MKNLSTTKSLSGERFILLGVVALFLCLPMAARAQTAVFSAPTISVAPDTYYPFDEILYIEGHAMPRSTVSLYFEKTGSQPIRLSVEANSNGEWYFAQKLELASGEWMLRARTENDPPSDWSNPRIIISYVSGFAIGSLKIKYVPVVLGLSGFFLIGLGLFLYSSLRIKVIKKVESEQRARLEKEDLENKLRVKNKEVASMQVEGEFSSLRRNIMEEISHFDDKKRFGEELTKEESEHHEQLLRDLNQIEVSIENKLKNLV